MSAGKATVATRKLDAEFVGVKTGADLAKFCDGVCLGEDEDSAFAVIVTAVTNGFDLRRVILDGTLSKESEGFWQLNQMWSRHAQILPAGSYDTVVDCSARLNTIGEPDLAAGLPLDALTQYCRCHSGELEDALVYALGNPETIKCISGVFLVGFEVDQPLWFSKAIALLDDVDDGTRAMIYLGLRMVNWDKLDETGRKSLAEVVRKGFTSSSEEVRYNAGGCAVVQAARSDDAELQAILDAVLQGEIKPEKYGIVEQCPSLFSAQDNVLNVAWRIVETLSTGVVDNRLVRGLDSMLSALWRNSPERALKCCEKVVLRNESVDSGCFPCTMSRLRGESGKVVNEAVTRWFLSNEPRLFRFAHALMEKRTPDDDFSIEVDAEAIHELADPLFVARKGVGWFYYHKKTCVRFVLSCMAIMNKDVVDDFLPTFYNPICLHYLNFVEECLRSRKADSRKPYYRKAALAVKQAKAFYAKAKEVLPIHDLEPTTRRRGEFSRYQSRLMAEAFRQAQEESPLLQLFASDPTILLHGKEWVIWRTGPSGVLRRNATKLSRDQIRIETPSLQNLDGLNLEYLLLRLRLERVSHEPDR